MRGLMMKYAAHSTTNVIPLPRSRGRSKPVRRGWFAALLEALHESRRRRALKVIRQHRRLFAKPEHMAAFMKAMGEGRRPTGRSRSLGAELRLPVPTPAACDGIAAPAARWK